MSDRGQWGCIGAVLAAIIGVLETQIAAQRQDMAASGSLIEVTRIVGVTTTPLPAPPPVQVPITVTVLAPSETTGST